MSLAEKIGQLTLLTGYTEAGPKLTDECLQEVRAGRVGTLSHLWGRALVDEVQRVAVEETRLGIPLLFAADVIHGHRTIFPIPLAEAGAFSPGLWELTARAAAEEAAADGLNLTYAPMLDVSRDPRWGRIAEGPGEDPWLAARYAAAKTRGFQGEDLRRPGCVAATAKHFAAYGAVAAGREYAAVDISARTLHEVYLPPFKAAVDAGVSAIMPAFTTLDGVPMSANTAMLHDLVRGRWRFDGVMISDYNAITELMNHGVAADIADAAALSLSAGMDIDLMGNAYSRGLPEALERGTIAMADIDAAVRRVLHLKRQLGLFDDPYRRSEAATEPARASRRELARDAGRRAIVLLQNRGAVLPLPPAAKIALIGPLADTAGEMLGPWASAGSGADAVSIIAGMRTGFPKSEVRHARGVDIDSDDASAIPAAVDLARDADHIVLCLGEAALMSGEAASRARPDLPGRQRQLAEAVLGLGKPVVVLLSSGRPLLLPWLFAKADAVLATWFLGSEAGNAIADVLSGAYNPSGRLSVTWPVDVGQIPIFYSELASGRPNDPKVRETSKYLDLPNAPLFPFGHGLSYTRFVLRNLHTGSGTITPGQSLTVEVEVVNEGAVAGEETVLLFIRDVVASIARPVLELKGWQKIALAPGASGRVAITLAPDAFAFLGPDLEPRVEPGVFEIFVGPRADRSYLLKTSVRLVAAAGA